MTGGDLGSSTGLAFPSGQVSNSRAKDMNLNQRATESTVKTKSCNLETPEGYEEHKRLLSGSPKRSVLRTRCGLPGLQTSFDAAEPGWLKVVAR